MVLKVHLRGFFLVLFFLLLVQPTIGQEFKKDSINANDNLQFFQAKLIGNHPLGMYMMRLESNYRLQAVRRKRIQIQISSANVWEPLVSAYKPELESDRAYLRTLNWYDREYAVDYNSIASQSLSLQADAVIKGIQMAYLMPLGSDAELEFDLRSYLFTKGKIPFSFFSSDRLIEFFHSNIAGGEDPFARKVYGLDQAEIHYIDEEGRKIEKRANAFVLPGFEIHSTYFIPSEFLHSQDFYINLGSHLGLNTNTYNPSADFGISSTFIKQIPIKKNKVFQLGAGCSFTIPSFIRWGDAVNIDNQAFVFTADWQLSYQAQKSKDRKWEIALNYHHQNPYQNPKDLDGIILVGARYSSHWHYAISHLYTSLTAWSLVYNYSSRHYAFSIYLTEDVKVNNAPDIQTGVQLSLPF
jgi:hypothetical protein